MIDDKDSYKNFELTLRIGQNQIRMQGELPMLPVNLTDLLNNLYSLTDTIIQAAIAEQSKTISCRVNCSHCCKQLVPINTAEAHHLARLLENLPQSHRDRIQRRLDRIHKKLARHEALNSYLQNPSQYRGQRHEIRQLGLQYFSLGLDCPFLKDNRCSIYHHRPMACREYLVTSAPSLCNNPSQYTVDTLVIPKTLSSILYKFADGKGHAPYEVVPLVMFQDYAQKHPIEELITLPGDQWLNNIIAALAN